MLRMGSVDLVRDEDGADPLRAVEAAAAGRRCRITDEPGMAGLDGPRVTR